jgi:hypothetical protein
MKSDSYRLVRPRLFTSVHGVSVVILWSRPRLKVLPKHTLNSNGKSAPDSKAEGYNRPRRDVMLSVN